MIGDTSWGIVPPGSWKKFNERWPDIWLRSLRYLEYIYYISQKQVEISDWEVCHSEWSCRSHQLIEIPCALGIQLGSFLGNHGRSSCQWLDVTGFWLLGQIWSKWCEVLGISALLKLSAFPMIEVCRNTSISLIFQDIRIETGMLFWQKPRGVGRMGIG